MLEWAKILVKLAYDRPTRCRLVGLRPVVLCLLQSLEQDKFLFISPTSKPAAWMPPQEGIEPNESIEKAAIRGVGAELGITENQLHFRRSVWLGAKQITEQKGERDVAYSLMKMRGKAYYASLIKLSSQTVVVPNVAEIANHEWLSLEGITSRLKTNSGRKQKLIRAAFEKLLSKKL